MNKKAVKKLKLKVRRENPGCSPSTFRALFRATKHVYARLPNPDKALIK